MVESKAAPDAHGSVAKLLSAKGVIKRVRRMSIRSGSSKDASTSPAKEVATSSTTSNSTKDASASSSQGKESTASVDPASANVPSPDVHAVAPSTAAKIVFGPNVYIFSADGKMADIQAKLDELHKRQESNEFGNERVAIFFKPGHYQLDVNVGYYTTVHGLGAYPGHTVIKGAVRAKANWMEGNNATINFWRGIENLSVIPTLTEDDKKVVWATSQGTWIRRCHIQGPLVLSDHGGWSSGGFLADSKVDGLADNGTQQQYLLRNTSLTKNFTGGSYAQVFVGSPGAPKEDWPAKPYSTIERTPSIREKPFLSVDGKGNWFVSLSGLRSASIGASWEDKDADSDKGNVSFPLRQVNLSTFYIAHAGQDTSDTLNAALDKGKSILFTPGVYELDAALRVTEADTVLLGLGLATLKVTRGTSAVTVTDIDGVHLAGLLLDAGENVSDSLLRVGDTKSTRDHTNNPTVLSDVLCRVGGAAVGKANKMIVVNNRGTILDNSWLWRADHEKGVGWDLNTCTNGLIVAADDVIAYGLFVEHCHGYQTLWIGDRGQVFFYQSEFPYDPPSNKVWNLSGVNGFPSLKISDAVSTFFATGVGIYCVFLTDKVRAHTAVEQPLSPTWQHVKHIVVRHVTTKRFGGNAGTGIDHVINGIGGAAEDGHPMAQLEQAYRV